jgi:hypothetical protein
MLFSARGFTLTTALLVPLSFVRAETADPSGHWEGAIDAPSGEVHVAIDVALDDAGKLMGTFSNPSQHLNGFPLWNVAVEGQSVRLELKTSDPGVQTFAGTLSADGQSMSGDFLVSVYAVPFTFTRTGEARIAAAPRSVAIDEALAGDWSATLNVAGKELPVVLKLRNNTDGTASGTWAIASGVATPVKIEQRGRNLTLESTVAPVVYTGALISDASSLSGTFKEGTSEQPLTFSRMVAAR